MDKKSLRIVFFGTPEFAVSSLRSIVEEGYNVVGVVTSTDKPAGRGRNISESEVKKYALEKNLLLLQPENLKSPDFLRQLADLKADLQVVVAFRMLPREVWSMPALGTFNLHASLLPQYRGAAPINWAIINGEKETGVTTFFLNDRIDEGSILLAEKTNISVQETAGQLHDKLKEIGSKLVLRTIDAILNKSINPIPQEKVQTLKSAPKLYKEMCRINWNKPGEQIINHIRGLSPYPAATTQIIQDNEDILSLKIYEALYEETENSTNLGCIFTDNKSYLKVSIPRGYIRILELQQNGKKKNGN